MMAPTRSSNVQVVIKTETAPRNDDREDVNFQSNTHKDLEILQELSESEIESDAGASPSFSSEFESSSSTVSSRSSSPGGLRICETKQIASAKKKKTNSSSKNTCNKEDGLSPQQGSGHSRQKSGTESPKVSRRQVSCSSPNFIASVLTPVKVPGKLAHINTPAKEMTLRNRKRRYDVEKIRNGRGPTVGRRNIIFDKQKKIMNRRRRTKSQRNNRASKVTAATATSSTTVQHEPIPVVREEDGVALDAEIDKILEDKAMKNNLTATNVKSIIRHVITNNMVQKMVMSSAIRKGRNPDDSSDDEGCYEPKLTRARTRLLLGNCNTSPPLWPLSSPAKSCPPPISETQVLIHNDLPEDSSGDDEEYIPNPHDTETHSEDEFSSSVASHTSDAGSPRIPTPVVSCRSGTRKRPSSSSCGFSSDLLSPLKNKQLPCFKTPPIKPKCARRIMDSAIGQRTRSKLPLNDTPLEDLEMQLIPPDITTDMYDWGIIDNEDYLGFVNEFLRPCGTSNNEGGDDEEADPEYNVMEEEEVQDKEELRMDRAVKVSKKELSELFAELLDESHFPSGDELDETDFTSFCASQLSHMSIPNLSTGCNETSSSSRLMKNRGIVISESAEEVVVEKDEEVINTAALTNSTKTNTSSPSAVVGHISGMEKTSLQLGTDCNVPSSSNQRLIPLPPCSPEVPLPPSKQPIIAMVLPQSSQNICNKPSVSQLFNLFDETTRSILEHQLREHVQLLAQTYALTASRDDADMKAIAQNSKRMIIEIRNIKILNGERSTISNVHNCEAAWQFVNSWPVRPCSRSPIKKKILVEQYMNECNPDWGESLAIKSTANYFPRPVAKAIAESDAFIFPNLLPTTYNQKSEKRCPFVSSEDKLLILALDQLKDEILSCREKSEIISATLLASRTPAAVYHRIRNQRKMSSVQSQDMKDYFELGRLPSGATPPPAWHPGLAVSPIKQGRDTLPGIWGRIVSSLLLAPEPENVGRRDLVNSKTGRHNRTSTNQSLGKSYTKKLGRKTNDEFIRTTFPVGTSMVQHHAVIHPDLTAMPFNNVQGDAGVYMLVPNYALLATTENSSSQPGGPETGASRRFYHPVPFYKPPANASKIPQETADQHSSLVTVTPVGVPISLPGVHNDFVNLSCLNTPMKMAVMQQIEVSQSAQLKDNYQQNAQIEDNRDKHSARTFGNNEIINERISSSENISANDDKDMAIICQSKYSNEIFSNQDSMDHSSISSSSETNSSSSSESECECEYNNCEPPLLITLDEDERATKADPSSSPDHVEPVDANDNNDQSKQSNKNENPSAAKEGIENTTISSSVEGGHDPSNRGNGNNREDDGDEEGDDNRNHGKNGIPEDAVEDEMDKEYDTEEDHEHEIQPTLIPIESSKPSSSSSRRGAGVGGEPTKRKTTSSSKRSSTSPPKKKRMAKGGVPIESMLEDDPDRDEEVCDAFMKAFLRKVQITTESNHPNIHAEFIKLIAEAGEINISEENLLSKVKTLFKDYPFLALEFSTFMQRTLEHPEDEVSDFSEFQDLESQVNFLRHLEKFTEKSPQLKAKIIHKFKILNEKENVTSKDLADALAPFFQASPVMMNAFQALNPSVYLPGSVSDRVDFEELDMENEATSQDTASDIELVTLPDEKTIPATTTCPCMCHETATHHAYSSRVKHCNKCCIKFQDGKVFVHSGRVVRPVNVELMSPSCARKLAAEMYETTSFKMDSNPLTTAIPQIKADKLTMRVSSVVNETAPQNKKTSSIPPELELRRDVEEGEILDDETPNCDKNNQFGTTSTTSSDVMISTPVHMDVSVNSGVTTDVNSTTTLVNLRPWSFDEDELIMSTWKAESSDECAFSKLETMLPNRDRTEIESRCVELLSMFQSMRNCGEEGIEENVSQD